MPARPTAPVLLLLAGVLVLFVGVVAQLTVVDGVAETLWVLVSIVGAVLIAVAIGLLVRGARRRAGGHDDRR